MTIALTAAFVAVEIPGALWTGSLGTQPEFWLNLQSPYELRLAEERAAKTIKHLPTLKRRKGKHQPAHT